jgi:hypothetical protein
LRKTAAVVAVLVAVGWVSLAACSNQGEGERCELFNNNDDCENGLICTAAGELASQFAGSDRCCPPDRTQATTEACRTPRTGPIGDATPPPDTGPAPTPDASGDADAATDAADAADAPDDG